MFDSGYGVDNLTQAYFEGGHLIHEAYYGIDKVIDSTNQSRVGGHDVVFEAIDSSQGKAYLRIDIQKNQIFKQLRSYRGQAIY